MFTTSLIIFLVEGPIGKKCQINSFLVVNLARTQLCSLTTYKTNKLQLLHLHQSQHINTFASHPCIWMHVYDCDFTAFQNKQKLKFNHITQRSWLFHGQIFCMRSMKTSPDIRNPAGVVLVASCSGRDAPAATTCLRCIPEVPMLC